MPGKGISEQLQPRSAPHRAKYEPGTCPQCRMWKPSLFLPGHFPPVKDFREQLLSQVFSHSDRVFPAMHPIARNELLAITHFLHTYVEINAASSKIIPLPSGMSWARALPCSSKLSVPLSNSPCTTWQQGPGMNRSWPCSLITYAEYVPDCGLAMDS